MVVIHGSLFGFSYLSPLLSRPSLDLSQRDRLEADGRIQSVLNLCSRYSDNKGKCNFWSYKKEHESRIGRSAIQKFRNLKSQCQF